jgi:phosphatidate cytidylyltransferase
MTDAPAPSVQEKPSGLPNLVVRILLAAVGIPLVLFVSYQGGFLFLGFVILVGLLALHEFYAMARRSGARPLSIVGIIAGFFVIISFGARRLETLFVGAAVSSGGVSFPSPFQILLFSSLGLMLAALLVELFRIEGSPFANLGVTILGVFYIAFFLGTLVGVRELFPAEFPIHRFFPSTGVTLPDALVGRIESWGGLTVISLFSIIWICDTAAYFIGLSIGRHPLFPRVSPKKTWEGAIGGFVFAIVAGLAARAYLIPYLTIADALVLGGIVGIFGQIGDLIESRFKRDANVKDSSSLLPGHGGVLDRFDSLIFVSPLVYLYLDFIVFR